jgi:hypothetical protein
MCIIFAEARPASTTKDAKEIIIGLDAKKTEQRRLFVEDWGRHAINEVASSQERFIPKMQRQ